jgi:molybdopterin-guanine dinucleotide biosynthesis protein A
VRDSLDLRKPQLSDAGPDAGPLGGIVAGLEQSATEWGFFLAVDTPLVPIDLLHALANAARKTSAGCVIPVAGGRRQPLCGLYRRSLAPDLRCALAQGNYKITRAVEESSATLEWFDVDAFAAGNLPSTSPENWFLNINTPEDWQQARRFSQLPLAQRTRETP